MFILGRLDNPRTTIQGEKWNFYQPKSLLFHQIKTISIVAAFDDFYTDIAVSKIEFY